MTGLHESARQDSPASRLSMIRTIASRGWTQLERAFVRFGALPFLMVLLVVVFASLDGRFISLTNLLNVSQQGIYLLLIALAQMLVLLSGGFDLSVGSNVALTSIGSGLVMSHIVAANPDSGLLAVVAGFAVAVLIGLVVGLSNGVGVSILRVSPFIVTLATSSVFQGLTLFLSQGQEVGGLPDQFVNGFGSGIFLGIPVAFYLVLPLVGLLYVLVSWTRYGRYLYAIGANPTAARVSGVRLNLNLVMTYVFAGVITAIAGWLLTARVSSGQPLLGGEFPLQSITAAVIGGVSLRGGEGGFGGTILGAAFVVLLSNGMDLIRMGSYDKMIALGLILVLAVLADRWRARVRRVIE